MGRWRSAAAAAVDLLSSRGSACLQRAHSTARGNSRIAGWTRSVVCSFVPESFGLDSAALVIMMVGRSQHVCVGRCRPFGREGSARNAGAPGGLVRTMVRAWVVDLLKFFCRAAAWRQLFLAEPTGPGQVGGVSPPASLGVESRAAVLTVAAFAARPAGRRHTFLYVQGASLDSTVRVFRSAQSWVVSLRERRLGLAPSSSLSLRESLQSGSRSDLTVSGSPPKRTLWRKWNARTDARTERSTVVFQCLWCISANFNKE